MGRWMEHSTSHELGCMLGHGRCGPSYWEASKVCIFFLQPVTFWAGNLTIYWLLLVDECECGAVRLPFGIYWFGIPARLEIRTRTYHQITCQLARRLVVRLAIYTYNVSWYSASALATNPIGA